MRNMANIKEAVCIYVYIYWFLNDFIHIYTYTHIYGCLFINVLRFMALLRHYQIWKWTTVCTRKITRIAKTYSCDHGRCVSSKHRSHIKSRPGHAISWILKALCVRGKTHGNSEGAWGPSHLRSILLIIYWAVSGVLLCYFFLARDIVNIFCTWLASPMR